MTPCSPTPSWPTRLRRREPSARTALACCALGLLASATLSPSAQAHGLEAEGVPLSPGWRLGAGLDLGVTASQSPWPTGRHAGVLLTGQTERDRRHELALNQATLAAGWRLSDALGLEAVASTHDNEAVHLDTARLEARTSWAGGELRGRLGRQPVSMGPMIDGTASFDRFSQAPLALQAALYGSSWGNDGLALQWQQPLDDEAQGPQWQSIELGVWRGHAFPGAAQGPAVPSLRLGWAWGHASAQVFGAWLQPEGRGAAALSSATTGHSHGVPDCRQSLQNRVCFDGTTHLAGASLALDGLSLGTSGQATLSAGALMRQDEGALYSTSATADYTGRSLGWWGDALWTAPGERWQAALRLERLTPQNTLRGANVASLAAAAGLDGGAPVRRATLALGYSPFGSDASAATQGVMHLWLETGTEQARGQAAHPWVGLRAQWLAPRWLGGIL